MLFRHLTNSHSSFYLVLSRMSTITLVRHGETKLNRAKVVQSRTPGELTERGILMAQALGKFLEEETFTRVYTSDLKRCHDTTLNILGQLKKPCPEIQLDEVLRERDYGDLEFHPGQLVIDIINKTGLPCHAIPIPGGETYEATKKRCAKFFGELCKVADAGDGKENILVVSHGTWIQCLLDYLMESTVAFQLTNLNENDVLNKTLDNTGRTKFHIHKASQDISKKREINFFCVYDRTHLKGIPDS